MGLKRLRHSSRRRLCTLFGSRLQVGVATDEDRAKAVKIGIWGANSKIHPNSLTSLGGKCHVRDTAPPAIEAEPEPDYDLPALPPHEGADA